MNRCLKMTVKMAKWDSDWSTEVQKKAKKLEIEGLMQISDDAQITIMACGKDAQLDDFIDYLYDFLLSVNAQIEELEPFIKERDFRGIFRVI